MKGERALDGHLRNAADPVTNVRISLSPGWNDDRTVNDLGAVDQSASSERCHIRQREMSA
jgi:hypothetical protein